MKIFKKLIALLLVFLFIFSTCANVFAATTKQVTYKNSKFGYLFQYESTWKLNGSDANSYSCYLRPVTYKGTAIPQIIVDCETLYNEMSMDDVAAALTKSFKSKFTGLKQVSSKTVNTSLGADSRELVYSFKQYNKDVKQKVTAVIKDGVLYQIIYAAVPADYNKYEAAYNTLLKSINVNSGATNTLGLPCIYTVLASDQVKSELSDKTQEDSDKISVATSYGSDRDVTSDAEYAVKDLIGDVIKGKYDEKAVSDKYSGVSKDIPSNQALIDLSKKYAALKNVDASFFSHGARVTKVVKDAGGAIVGGIVHLIYDITDKNYNRIEGGTMDVYVEFDEDGNAGVFGLVK